MFVLPSRTVNVEATASGLMLDVRTGYPYATLTTHADRSGVSRAVSEGSTSMAYADTAEERAVAKLAQEFGDAVTRLELEWLEIRKSRMPRIIDLTSEEKERYRMLDKRIADLKARDTL